MEAEWSSMEASGDALSRLPLDLQLHILQIEGCGQSGDTDHVFAAGRRAEPRYGAAS
jgi:hypothetical protein